MTQSSEKPTWLCLFFPDLPLEIFLRGYAADEPPAVVLDHQRVTHLNEAAADLGVETGNNMDTAYTLSEHLISFERDADREKRVLSRLAQWAYQFTPAVSVPDSQNYLLLDITGCTRLFNGLDSLKHQIAAGLESLGFTTSIGAGTTPESSIIAAKHSGIISPDKIPITCLELGDDIKESLLQMGVRHIQQLFELPRSSLTRRFGEALSDYLDRLTGDRADPRRFITPKPDFSSEISFLTDVTDISSLVFPVRRLLGELAGFLKGRQLTTDHLVWRLSHRSHSPVSFSISLASPENDESVFLSLTQLRMDQVDNIPEVDSISLSARHFAPLSTSAGNLFPSFVSGVPGDSGKAGPNHLLNMIHARLGSGTCFGLSLANDHRPEKAWRLIRIGQHERWYPESDKEDPPRPLFLMCTPRRLNVIDGCPCMAGRLDLLAGPERIDFGWWDASTPSTRDYYVARQKSGSLLWVFEHLAKEPGWYLHGFFS